ncbi:MAG: NfeD family protein [Clostridiaceae bacterium]|nr:NfeD family protein [Clostridiaceae bacterium]
MGTYTYIWIGLTIVLIAIEAATVSLTTIWLAAGSLIAFVISLFKLPLWSQIISFLAVSILLLIFTRPVAVKYLKVGDHKTNVDMLIGQKGIVIMDITEHATGQVKVRGQVWTAVSKTGENIKKDTEVVIEEIQGVKLIVSAL